MIVQVSDLVRLNESFLCMAINEKKCSFQIRPIVSSSNLNMDFSGHNLFLLHPLRAPSITIKATNIIAFDLIIATTDKVFLAASSKIVLLGAQIHSQTNNYLYANEGKGSVSLGAEDRHYLLSQFAEGLANCNAAQTATTMVETYDAITDPYRISNENVPSPNEQEVIAFFDLKQL